MTKLSKKGKTVKQAKRIRSGDQVVVIAGNDKGRTGEVLSRTADRVVVSGINVRKKHVRRSQENPQGRIAEIEMGVHISNVALCSAEGKPFKARARVSAEGQKDLVFKDGSNEILHRSIKNSK
ncbi:MAG: 50S ribosomal protein L24 [Waddliaceae bacterium]|nr:50S ribosomal protein L24 [Waddliaceae bacterium]